jgi:hypothetical protein
VRSQRARARLIVRSDRTDGSATLAVGRLRDLCRHAPALREERSRGALPIPLRRAAPLPVRPMGTPGRLLVLVPFLRLPITVLSCGGVPPLSSTPHQGTGAGADPMLVSGETACVET